MEIDYDYLRIGTAIGFRASRELCSNCLFSILKQLIPPLTSLRFYSKHDHCDSLTLVSNSQIGLNGLHQIVI